jgi:hypothetical protein
VTGFRVRRLAVIDLHGRCGSAVRLWLVRAEFPLAAALFIAFAVLFADHGTLTGWVLGIVFVGIGCNYLVLTAWMLIRDSRDGTHIGLLAQAESNEVPSAAKRSRFGVRTCGCPAHPAAAAVCSSDRITTTFGRSTDRHPTYPRQAAVSTSEDRDGSS